MAKSEDKILALHPDPDKEPTRIDRVKYEVMKKALLAVIPSDDEGVPFKELHILVEPHLPEDVWGDSSVKWYVTTLKLDLEARGVIERVAGAAPQRVRRC